MDMVDPPLALTYDDVLLVPRRSRISSRRNVDTCSRFSRRIEVATPIVSANMDTVTEADMAIAMARLGGIGVIHRFMSLETEAQQVRKVKRSESSYIENPYALQPHNTVGDALKLMDEQGITGILVTDADGVLQGILTSRDLLFREDMHLRINDVMTPRERLITAPVGTSVEQAKDIFAKHKIEKLPLVDGDGKLRGLVTSKDIYKRVLFPDASKDDKGRLRVAAAIGVVGDYMERAQELHQAGADALVIDIAHGHSENCIRALESIRAKLGAEVEIVAGNVATAEGVRDLVEAGADAVKVGVGPGSICITRIVAGVGVPQLSAALECAREGDRLGIPILADGGIQASGDVTKALAAGASTVMIGNLLAGTRESPGVTITRNGRKFKICRGMASLEAAVQRQHRESMGQGLGEDLDSVVPEGVEAMVPFRGEVSEVVTQLVGGLRSGMSYCDAATIPELREKAQFVRMTEAGRRESTFHGVELV
jgi:IMP dehydrogenase